MNDKLLQNLDEVLKILSDTTESNPIEWTLLKYLNPSLSIITNRNWEAIRRKLVADKMIDFVKEKTNNLIPDSKEEERYFITIDGLLLLEFEDGYAGRYNSTQSESNRIKSLEKWQGRYSLILSIFTGLSFFVSVSTCWLNCDSYLLQKNHTAPYTLSTKLQPTHRAFDTICCNHVIPKKSESLNMKQK